MKTDLQACINVTLKCFLQNVNSDIIGCALLKCIEKKKRTHTQQLVKVFTSMNFIYTTINNIQYDIREVNVENLTYTHTNVVRKNLYNWLTKVRIIVIL